MKWKKQGKKREIKALAFVLAAGMLLQPASVNASSESMKISADIVQEDQKPSYMVVVPSSVALGSLSTQTDTVQNYEVRIKTTDAKGTIEVSAPESGVLHNQENTRNLPITLESNRLRRIRSERQMQQAGNKSFREHLRSQQRKYPVQKRETIQEQLHLRFPINKVMTARIRMMATSSRIFRI